MFVFRKIWRALFSWNTVLRFVLLSYYRQNKPSNSSNKIGWKCRTKCAKKYYEVKSQKFNLFPVFFISIWMFVSQKECWYIYKRFVILPDPKKIAALLTAKFDTICLLQLHYSNCYNVSHYYYVQYLIITTLPKVNVS